MNTLQRIFVACFCGATIGALLAIQFNHYFWWAGILLGGVTGYLSYEFKAVVRAVKTAWEEVCREYDTGFSRLRQVVLGTGKVILATGKVILIIITGLTYLTYFATLFIVVGASWFLLLALLAFPHYFVENSYGYITFSSIFMGIMLGAFTLVTYSEYAIKYRGFAGPTPTPEMIPWMFVDANLFSVLFRWLPKLVILYRKKIPMVFNFFGKLAKRTFILIHSEIRLLCMTDAMLGAFAGYFCGNALIGGGVGAILGVVNYKLVSVRWLKLVRA